LSESEYELTHNCCSWKKQARH